MFVCSYVLDGPNVMCIIFIGTLHTLWTSHTHDHMILSFLTSYINGEE
jgi:hypothetical protein